MKTIITIQHPESEQHLNRMIGSWADWQLTSRGTAQARSIGAHLAAELEGRSCILYSSDLLRTRQTAEILAERLGVVPVFTDALREFNLGEAVGKSKVWAREHVQCATWQGSIDWPLSADDRPFRGAESKREVGERLSHFLEKIMANDAETILLVSHDGTLSILFALWLGLDLNMLERCNIAGRSGGVSFLREDDDGRRSLVRLNDLSYIQPNLE